MDITDRRKGTLAERQGRKTTDLKPLFGNDGWVTSSTMYIGGIYKRMDTNYKEWMLLIKEAKRMGITKGEISEFLRQATSIKQERIV